MSRNSKAIDKYMSSGGCLVSPEDSRDYTVEMVSLAEAPLPETYECKKMPVLNQGSVGSCVAHCCATALGYGELKSGMSKPHDFSRGFIYGNRKDTDYQGEGMHIRQALKQLNHCGDCQYKDFPYNETYPQVKARIDKNKDALMAAAEPYKILNYFRCFTKDEVKKVLLNQGAVILSVPVYDSFSKDCPMPQPGEKTRGNHAMCVVGWDKTGWIIQNSWGKFWGKCGFLHIPYEYPINEFWGITVNINTPVVEKENILIRILKWLIEKITNLKK